MTIYWNNFAKNIFTDLISDVKDFDAFETKLSFLKNNKLKGDCFEYFAKLYFELLPTSRQQYNCFYLYNEIPADLIDLIKLPSDQTLYLL